MECGVYISRLNDLVDGAVPAKERGALEEHARTCDACRSEREELDAMLLSLNALADEDAPSELHTRVMNQINATHKRKRTGFFIKIGGCVAAGLLLIAIPIGLSAALGNNGGYINSEAQISESETYMMKMADSGAYAGSMTYGASEAGALRNESASMPAATGAPIPAPEMAYDDAAYPEEAPAAASGGGELWSTNSAAPEREAKRVMSGSLSLRSKAFDDDQQAIISMVNEMGGYIENSYSSGLPLDQEPEYGGRTLNLAVRVPSQAFDAFMKRVKGIGQLNWSSQNAQDITDQYYDTQTRMDTLKIQYDRLTDILKKSVELKDVLALETEMARVQYEIESLAGSLRHWDSQVDYSSISIDMQEVRKLERVTPVDPTLPERMYEGLIHTLNGIVKFFENTLVGIVTALPFILFIVVVGVVVFAIVRRQLKRNK